jgi:hypothetical protein
MKRSNFFAGQNVTDDDLNFDITAQNDQQRLARTAFLTPNQNNVIGGVIGYSGLNTLLVTSPTSTTVTVLWGYAITNAGEIIYVPSTPSTENPPLPARQGLTWGTTGETLYVKISYAEIPGSPQVDDFGHTVYSRYYPSYQITIDEDPPDASQILLAQFDSDESGHLSNLVDKRAYIQVKADAYSVRVEDSPVYGHQTVDSHVKAVGTGTPSVTNPHGQSVYDLDDVSEISPVAHRQQSHTSGILPINLTSPNDWKASIVQNDVSDYLHFEIPTAGSFLIVNGTVITAAIADLTPQGVLTESGYYFVLVDDQGVASFLTTTNAEVPADKFWVTFVYYDATAATLHRDSGGPRSNPQDYRAFFTMDVFNIQADVPETELAINSDNPILSRFDDQGCPSTLRMNLQRLRYVIRMIHGGDQWYDVPNDNLSTLATQLQAHTHDLTDLWVNRSATSNLDDVSPPNSIGGGVVWLEEAYEGTARAIMTLDNSIDWRDRVIAVQGFMTNTVRRLDDPDYVYRALFGGTRVPVSGVSYTGYGTRLVNPLFSTQAGLYLYDTSGVSVGPGLFLFVANQGFASPGALLGIHFASADEMVLYSVVNPPSSHIAGDLRRLFLKIDYSPQRNVYGQGSIVPGVVYTR